MLQICPTISSERKSLWPVQSGYFAIMSSIPTTFKGFATPKDRVYPSPKQRLSDGTRWLQVDLIWMIYDQILPDQGHSTAQFNIGTCYDAGRGVEKSDTLAAKVRWSSSQIRIFASTTSSLRTKEMNQPSTIWVYCIGLGEVYHNLSLCQRNITKWLQSKERRMPNTGSECFT